MNIHILPRGMQLHAYSRSVKEQDNQNSYKILVTDDEENIRNLLCETLRLSGYSPTPAQSGTEALTLIKNTKFDLVLLDINMPVVNGFMVLEKIRSSNSNLPVIMLSARADKSDVVAGLRDGADDYVSKPFSIEELITRVSTVLRRVSPKMQESILRVGPIKMDLNSYEVYFNSDLIELSRTEFRLLQYLMSVLDSSTIKRIFCLQFGVMTSTPLLPLLIHTFRI